MGPGALRARPPSRNHMIQKNAKEAGWEVPSRKTKHWDGSLAQPDVDALCRAFPKRCKKMDDAQGGRLSY